VVAPSFPVDDLARNGFSLVRAVGAVLLCSALLSPAADARASTALIDLRSRFLHTKKIKKARST